MQLEFRVKDTVVLIVQVGRAADALNRGAVVGKRRHALQVQIPAEPVTNDVLAELFSGTPSGVRVGCPRGTSCSSVFMACSTFRGSRCLLTRLWFGEVLILRR